MLFDDKNGRRRYEARGGGSYSVYELRSGAYVHEGIVHIDPRLKGQKRLIALSDEALMLGVDELVSAGLGGQR